MAQGVGRLGPGTAANADGGRRAPMKGSGARQLRCTVMCTVSDTEPAGEVQVTAKVTVKLEPSNAEYVVAPRVQSGMPAVAASH